MVTERQVRRLAGALGAEIRGLDLATIDEDGFGELTRLLREHQVVFLPDQHLAPEAHCDLGRRFGEIEIHPFLPKLDDGYPEIVVLRSEQGMIADVWHRDVTFDAAAAGLDL